MSERLSRLAGLVRRERRLVLGLMSGMSRDGLDVALVGLDGLGKRPAITLVAHRTFAYDAALRTRIRQAARGTTRDVCLLDRDLAERWAGNVLELLEDEGLSPDDVDLMGSHGQTLDHVPRVDGASAATLQVGHGDVLAERTGILTLSDFRPRDIAAGGEGAPLVPYADWVLFSDPDRPVACHNLGSIANVAVVTERVEDMLAFDTGPANTLLDGVIRLRTSDERAFDRDGVVSSSGTPRVEVHRMLQEARGAWLERPPPKSAGYDDFGPPLAAELVARHPDLSTEDLARSALEFTVSTIRQAYALYVCPRYPALRTVRLSGGGARNPVIVAGLRDALGTLGLEATPLDDAWIDAKEAVAFAILADATARGLPSNVPAATGARHAVPLGTISLP